MKIYIDLGAYEGDSIDEFLKRPDAKEFEIYAFEPNPNLFSALAKYMELPNVKQIDTGAAWVEDEIREFAVDQTATPMGSTLMPSKVDIWDTMPHYEVHCFDFSEWVKQFKDNYLIVKMDIEGAEFPILEKMIADNTDKHMDELWVEVHPNKVRDYTTTYSDDLIERLKNRGVEVTLWH